MEALVETLGVGCALVCRLLFPPHIYCDPGLRQQQRGPETGTRGTEIPRLAGEKEARKRRGAERRGRRRPKKRGGPKKKGDQKTPLTH